MNKHSRDKAAKNLKHESEAIPKNDVLEDMPRQGIDFPLHGHTISVMPTNQVRKLGMGQVDIPLEFQVLRDSNVVGYLERGQDVLLAWMPYELDDGTPAEVQTLEEAVRFVADLA
ncbi:hypothetical protein BH11ACT2_BH11ACT2_00980 [soil metagenome]